MYFDTVAGALKTHPARWLKVGYAVLESNGCLLRFA
jgi:hypothetical protein